jgi:hypothetical protein
MGRIRLPYSQPLQRSVRRYPFLPQSPDSPGNKADVRFREVKFRFPEIFRESNNYREHKGEKRAAKVFMCAFFVSSVVKFCSDDKLVYTAIK